MPTETGLWPREGNTSLHQVIQTRGTAGGGGRFALSNQKQGTGPLAFGTLLHAAPRDRATLTRTRLNPKEPLQTAGRSQPQSSRDHNPAEAEPLLCKRREQHAPPQARSSR